MDLEERRRLAQQHFERAYAAQMRGNLEQAIEYYRYSIDLFPTAEAYTFLGWAHSLLGRLDEAIQECRKAIEADPDYGNPYNDIGAYLIKQGKLDEAIPWLEGAICAKRYDSYCFPWMNLGRVLERKAQWYRALECYKKALECKGDYAPAAKALARLRGMLN